MKEEALVGVGEIDGKECYVFLQSERGEIYFKAILDAVEHLIKKEKSFNNTEWSLEQNAIVHNEDKNTYVYPIGFTVKDKDSGDEVNLDEEELKNKIAYVLEMQFKKQEKLAEMESKIDLLNITFDEEREILIKYLLADENEEQVLYAEFLKELEYNLITLKYVVDKKGVVIYIHESLLAKLNELQLKNVNLDEEEDYITVKETTNEETFETFRKICKFFDVKPEDIKAKINGMKELMEMGR